MKFEFSAGGIVYKNEQGKLLILVAQHSAHHGWVFPKGLIGDHPSTGSEPAKKESKEETAVREVQEETGVTAEILQPLTPISFWYQWQGEKRKKTVYYFVMRYNSGDIDEHDKEMEKVEWLSADEIEKRLTYPGEKKVWLEALEYLKTFLH